MDNPFTADDVLLLDGGLATELESMGHELNDKLWSARLLLEQPDVIIEAHLHYLRAGAQCIISASYQASLPGLMAYGLNRDEAENTLRLSVDLARSAVSQYCDESPGGTRPLVAASIGPYGAYLADGAEYRGDYGVNPNTLRDFHQSRLAILSDSDADLLACETIPSKEEAEVLNTLLAEQSKPAWVSFSCRDGKRLNDGNQLAEMGKIFAGNNNVLALGINCTAPNHINSLIEELHNATDKAIVVYPNSGEHFDPVAKCWHGETSPDDCGPAAISWRDRGASVIGGCCRMGPEHIAVMKTALNSD